MADRLQRRLTLRDVAAELGVSAKTVSNAYSRPDQLTPQLRRRILRTAERLGYPGPDPVAAGLRRGRVGAIGFSYENRLSYAFEDPVSGELLAGITGVVEDAGAGLLLLPGSATPEQRAAAITGAVVDGLIVFSVADNDPLLPIAAARRLPLVVIDQPRSSQLATLHLSATPWIGIDDQAAAYAAASHVLDLGHRHLAVISFRLNRDDPPGLATSRTQAASAHAVTRLRLAGYRQAAEERGIDWAGVPVWHGMENTPVGGAAAAAALLGATPRPSALLCLSDRFAEGALQAAADRGLSVPQQLSVVGFDNATPTADALGLTTVTQPNYAKGRLAAQTLLDLLSGRMPQPAQRLPSTLIVRSSTAPAGP
jgi:DNA-binding LacI/PurR family transcriptional regulator